jgi:hypothetical protein
VTFEVGTDNTQHPVRQFFPMKLIPQLPDLGQSVVVKGSLYQRSTKTVEQSVREQWIHTINVQPPTAPTHKKPTWKDLVLVATH